MKVKILFFMIMTVLLLPVNVFAAEAVQVPKPVEVPGIRIIIDGKLEKFEKVPISVNNSTLLPLRELLVKLGVPNDDEHIIYNHGEKSVTVWNDQTKIYLKIGQKEAFVNDKPISLNAAPVLYKSLTYIPLRFVAESMGKKVVWDGTAKAVLICDAAKYDSIKQILDKTDEEMLKIKKIKQEIDITGDYKSESGDFSLSTIAKRTIFMDILNKMAYKNEQRDSDGIKALSETYLVDNVAYTINPLLDNWSKIAYTHEEYDEQFKIQGNYLISGNDVLCTGLNQVDNDNDDEILLKGDVFLYDLAEKVLALQDSGSGRDMKFYDFSVEVSINKNTYLVNHVILDMKMSYKSGTEVLNGDINVKIQYSDYNGDFVITVPEDIVKNAVLVEVD